MPRARDPIYPQHFKSAGSLKWRCQICIGTNGGRGHAMTRKQAMYHEASRKHSSKAAATFFRNPEIFRYEDNGRWFCNVCNLTTKSIQKAKAHEAKTHGGFFMSEAEIHDLQDSLSSGKRSPVSALLTGSRGAESYNPQVASSSGEGSAVSTLLSSSWWAGLSSRTVDSSCEGTEAAERDEEAGSKHGLLDTPRRSEENGSTTSMHREGAVFERNDEDNNDNSNSNSNNGSDDDDNDNNNDDAAFVEDFLRCCGVQDAHGPENPKIREVIHDLQ